MKRDLPPATPEGTDTDLSSLFATLKDDKAPPDIESRLLQGLATAAATGAGIAVAKSSVWNKLLLWLATGGLSKSIFLGAAGGVLVCGAITLADRPGAPTTTEGLPASSPAVTGTLTRGGSTPTPGASSKEAADAPSTPNGAGATPAAETPSLTPVAASSLAPSPGTPSNAPGNSVPDSAPPSVATSDPAAPGTGTGTGASSPSPASPSAASTTEPADALRKELPLVRAIAALVDSGRCPEARTAIAAYRSEHPAGQLAAEVGVLAARCQNR